MTLQIMTGDCIELMRTLPDNSVDSIVTDPPYGLGFMGKAWDALPPGLEWAQECLRVLKPGGHLLAFGGTRTWHRLAVAVEDAGFDLRDSIAWMYGSGFPKSADVSKAIDKVRDDSKDVRVVCRWLRARLEEHPSETVRTIAERFGFHPRMVEHWAARDTDSQPALPKLEQWDALRSVLGFTDEMDSEVLRLNLRKGEPGEAWKDRPVTGVQKGAMAGWRMDGTTKFVDRDITAPATPEAKQWQGWGTALKPAFEPVVMGRKPFKGTVAANVLAHGTGALNIDASRIGYANHADMDQARVPQPKFGTKAAGQGTYNFKAGEGRTGETFDPSKGRFPANVILDEHTAALLDEQSGIQVSRPAKAALSGEGSGSGTADNASSYKTNGLAQVGYTDSGGASRFFYCAKAPKSERPVVDGVAHPTVKPLSLMRYLITLVTPPGGVVLEPFAGSGTTVEAALMDGFGIIAMERDETYLPLIQARIDRYLATQMEDLI